MKDAVAKIMMVLVAFLTFVGCASCANNSYLFGPGNLFRDKKRSFIKLDVYKNILVTYTSTASQTPQEEYELDLRSSASAFIVGHDRDITLVATSAHVCTIKFGNQINYFIPDYYEKNPRWKMREKAAYILNDYKGRKYRGFPVEYDLEADICIIASKKIPLPALTVSKQEPIVGEKYYNIAAPMGLWSKDMIPLFQGFYLGKMKPRGDMKTSYTFSIPTKGGSSGSPILNSYGEVVAAVHSAYRGFENLCMATTNKEIYFIYRTSMRKLLKDYSKYKLIIDLINI
tara:strand:+ start:412 stop:1269 length:858 start_codon:yes stop_codon:yes gene_type:complete